MKIQRQPNRASCVATSFAMVMGIPVEFIFKYLGHGGTKVIYPEAKKPSCYQGFHPQECLLVAEELGFVFSTYEYDSHGGLSDTEFHTIKVPWKWGLILESKGVMIGTTGAGKRHAIAWDGEEQLVYDPNGTIHPLGDFNFEYYYRLIK